MEAIQSARQGLHSLKNNVIGIYKHNTLGVYELVLSINKDDETIETVFISQFGAIQRGFGVQYQQGTLYMFEEGKNFNNILDNPIEFDNIIKSF